MLSPFHTAQIFQGLSNQFPWGSHTCCHHSAGGCFLAEPQPRLWHLPRLYKLYLIPYSCYLLPLFGASNPMLYTMELQVQANL